jgi:hypothetical protein
MFFLVQDEDSNDLSLENVGFDEDSSNDNQAAATNERRRRR